VHLPAFLGCGWVRSEKTQTVQPWRAGEVDGFSLPDRDDEVARPNGHLAEPKVMLSGLNLEHSNLV
jgi:hypothetical protein